MAAIAGIGGAVTRDGCYTYRRNWRRTQPTRTPIVQLSPLGVAVREACAAVLADELKPCQWCGSIAPCDCLRWHEYVLLQDADPHGDLSQFNDEDIPY